MRTVNYAYVTLLSTKDYLPGVLVLAESLKKVYSFFPLVVAVTGDIYDEVEETLKAAGCFVNKIDQLSYNENVIQKYKDDEKSSTVLNTASKISLFELGGWEKLVYIDADAIVLQNIDDLFNWPDGSMVHYPQDGGGFTGMMVFSPCQHRADFYKCLMQHFNCVDGDLLGTLWYPCKTNPSYQIPANYFVHYEENVEDGYTEPNKWCDIKALHFCNNPKPWQQVTDDYDQNHHWYMHYYQAMLQQVKEKYRLT